MNPQILVSQLSSIPVDVGNIDFSLLVGLDKTVTTQSSAGSVVTFPISSISNYINSISASTLDAAIQDIDSVFTTVNTNSASWDSSINYQTISVNSTTALTFDVDTYDEFVITLSGANVSANFGFPVNGTDRQTALWEVRFLSTSARVNLSSNFNLPSTTLNWSNSAGRFDIMAAKFNAIDNRWYVVSFLPGYII